MKFRHFVVLFIFVLLSCSDDSNPVDGLQDSFTYPLEVGNKWSYQAVFYYKNFRPFDNNDSISLDTSYFLYTVEITGIDSTNYDSPFYIFEEKSKDELGRTIKNNGYYQNSTDGLFKHYNSRGLQILPKKLEINKSVNSIDVASTSNQTYQILKYPLNLGDEWENENEYWRVNRKIIANENISTQAGEFSCFKIRQLVDVTKDGVWDDSEAFDYLSEKGLVKRENINKDIIMTTAEKPDGIGVADSYQVYSLINSSLN